jgi:Lrp/AsnC family leucine-responsive transcriptional regulator
MARTLDETDVLLLDELQRDADRPNVELARIAGLSPAATLNRVRRLKESGVIEGIHAKLDREQAGFGLCVYVSVTLGRHEEALERRFEKVVEELPQVTAAAWVAGETDALLTVVARDLAELQQVLVALSTRGGAQRVVTLLRLRSIKPDSPLPLGESRRLR